MKLIKIQMATNSPITPEKQTILELISSHQSIAIATLLVVTVLISAIFAKVQTTPIRNCCINATNSLWSLTLHLSGVIWASSVSIYNSELKNQIIARTADLNLIGYIFS